MSLLKWAAILAVLAIIAAILGFSNLAEGFAAMAQVLFFLFLAGIVILVALGLWLANRVTR
jgi:uncharacterized membrane protein YtjA (UPF0391 family)